MIAPSGITYDRMEIMEHFKRVGNFDPLTHKPLRETDLIPNRALKDALDAFVEQYPFVLLIALTVHRNGWALEY